MTRLSRKTFLGLGGSALAGVALAGLPNRGRAWAAPDDRGADAWSYVNRVILRHVQPPRFPAVDHHIGDFGAVADGTTSATGAIQAAIDHCSGSGGGRVVVPAGTYLTGALHLRDNVNLHVAEGATLLFSRNPEDYLPLVLTRFEGEELMNYSPFIHASGATNIALTGTGTIDGNATYDDWWSWVDKTTEDVERLGQMAADGVPVSERIFGAGHFLRPCFVEFHQCRNVLIEGLTVHRSPFWEIHPVLSQNITVRDLHIATTGPNNDGVDPESCRYVVIQRCTFDVGDDCIAIKSGREADGLRINVPSEDILIEGCTMRTRYGAITIGSEMTGGARNIFVRDCTLGGPNLYFGLYIKTNSFRGGFAENVYLRDLEISNLTKEVVSCNFYRGEGDTGTLTPRVRNIELRNVHVAHARNAFSITGYPRSPITDFRLVNCTYDAIDAASTISNAEISFHNVRVNGRRITEAAQLT